jgi:hypothetical protein
MDGAVKPKTKQHRRIKVVPAGHLSGEEILPTEGTKDRKERKNLNWALRPL